MISDSGDTARLSREAEITREGLVNSVGALNEKVAGTMDDLKERLSPSHIKEEIKDYVREESGQILSSIQRRARDNPLQAVAVGAALIYPFWGIIKSLPVPILLMGGGVWLSKQNNGKISRVVTESASGVAQSAADAKKSIITNVTAVTSTLSDTAQGVLDAATTTAGEAVEAVKGVSGDAFEKVSTSVSDVGGAAADAVTRSRTAFDDLIDKNPLLLGGVALAIGAFIAASIPISETENRLFGERSDEVKEKAVGAVSQGVDRAKDVAADIVGDIATAAAREGLSANGLSQTIEGTAVAIKAVVDKGLATALGDGAGVTQSPDAPANNLN
jgi:ElaB/YqjD/DUF883 family membrane-anchored ribosome-binding protein